MTAGVSHGEWGRGGWAGTGHGKKASEDAFSLNEGFRKLASRDECSQQVVLHCFLPSCCEHLSLSCGLQPS